MPGLDDADEAWNFQQRVNSGTAGILGAPPSKGPLHIMIPSLGGRSNAPPAGCARQKLILTNYQSPGDVVALTAAVRDLVRTYPNLFYVDVRTSCPDLWLHNPNITPISNEDPEAAWIHCDYPLIHHSNRLPRHFIEGFITFLNDKLDLQIQLSALHGDIHIGREEREWVGRLQELQSRRNPYWVVSAGGKYDFTIKWWDTIRFQRVVDHFRNRIEFVQVGEAGHHHPPLDGVIDLRGMTGLRQLVLLVFNSGGAITPVSLLMHLAAAVENPHGRGLPRPCVVIGGGREPLHWAAYPFHQYLHTIGLLPCCSFGGCWKSRTLPLGDGDERDHPDNLCVDVVGSLPRCMDIITADDVIRRIELILGSAQS